MFDDLALSDLRGRDRGLHPGRVDFVGSNTERSLQRSDVGEL